MEIPRPRAMKIFLLSSLLFVFAASAFGEETQEVELDGVLIERPDGGFLQFTLENNRIHFYFFDAEKKKIDPDVDRISVRIDRTQPRQRRQVVIAIPYEGVRGLRAPLFIQPPHIFRAYMSLLRDGSEDAVEFYVVHYPRDTTVDDPITVYEAEE